MEIKGQGIIPTTNILNIIPNINITTTLKLIPIIQLFNYYYYLYLLLPSL